MSENSIYRVLRIQWYGDGCPTPSWDTATVELIGTLTTLVENYPRTTTQDDLLPFDNHGLHTRHKIQIYDRTVRNWQDVDKDPRQIVPSPPYNADDHLLLEASLDFPITNNRKD